MERKAIKIRFNTYFKPGDGSKEWRVLVNGQENFCNHIKINCPSYTTHDFIAGVGDKWHISCEANHIHYEKDELENAQPDNYFREITIE